MKIVLLESLGISLDEMKEFENQLTELGHTFKAYEKTNDLEKQKEYTKDAEIIIIANMPLTREVISNANKLKLINIAFTGVEHVDLQAAKEYNIDVCNASGYSTQSVAELTIGLILNLLRNINKTEQRCRNNSTKDNLVGNELSGKTIGLIGVGKIGMRVAEISKAFGCKVLGYRTTPQDDGITYCSLEELLKNSDIVSLHCPANQSTKDLISLEQLKLMKKKAILINTARGSIVNQEDLAYALNNDIIAGAALDVFDIEPPLPMEHILLNTKNTIVTPHIAFATKESMIIRKGIVLENIVQWTNKTPINLIK